MNIWDLCIRRPVFTLMLVAAPVVLGIASYMRLGVELFPNVDMPSVTVTTMLRGASVEEMETQVTKPIEEIVNTIAGINELRSTTKEGISQVIIQFRLEKNGATAAQEVDAKIRTILGQLPEGTEPPIVDRLALDATPVITVAISGRRDPRELTQIARRRVKENLESLPGVGAVALVGGRQRAIQVILDPDRMLKYEGLTIEDVRLALLRENQEQPGGRVERGPSERVLRTLGRIEKPADFARLIVTNRNNQPVRIEDIGRVEDGYEEPRSISRLWISDAEGHANASHAAATPHVSVTLAEHATSAPGPTRQVGPTKEALEEPGDFAVSLVIQKQSGTNTVTVCDAVNQRLRELQSTLPDDIRMFVIRDQSTFIRHSMDEVKVHLGLAAVLVSASVLLFLRDWRTTIIATLAIPTSLVGTFAFMALMDFSINNFTMIGLILAVGIVVDDAVVVHENIFRHMEERGLTGWQAASEATREIALAVLATTLSLVVVFAPIAFMGGQVGRFLSCFGWVVGFSVLMSMFVSFTMTPMLCSRFLVLEHGSHSKDGFLWKLVERSYIGLLAWSLRRRWVVVVASLAILCCTPFLFQAVGFDFVPKDDQSEFEVAVTLPEGFSLNRADHTLNEIESRLRDVRGVTHTFITIGDTTGRVAKGQGEVTRANIYCRMTDLHHRDFTQFAAMEDARSVLAQFPDVRAAVQPVSAIQATGFRQVDIDLNVCGPDMQELERYSQQIAAWMKEQGVYVDVDTSLSFSKPELRIRPDRERLSDLGVSLAAISATTNVLVGGAPVSTYKERDEQYDVWLRAEAEGRSTEEAIARMTVPAATPTGVARLDNLVRFEQALGPNSIDRFGRQRQVVVSANLEGKDLSAAVADLRAYMETINLPPEYHYEFIGRAKMMAESNANFLLGFLMAFMFMYMILAAQFESLIHPISILAALPLTIPFAILSLILMGTTLDIFSMLGLFMLFGIVKKNGIMQVDYANQLRAQGLEKNEAILEANRARLRPILMTTAMLVAAMIPLALGNGPGSGTRASMAKVILGGQVLSLLLTLLVTPVCYSLFDSWGVWFASWFRRRKAADATPEEHSPKELAAAG